MSTAGVITTASRRSWLWAAAFSVASLLSLVTASGLAAAEECGEEAASLTSSADRRVDADEDQPLTPERRNLLDLLSRQAWDNMERGYVPLAEESFRAVLDEDPQHLDALTGLGAALVLQNRAAEALEHLETARDQGPDDAKVNFWLGRAYLSEDWVCAAISAFETVEWVSSNWPDLYVWLGTAYLQDEQRLTALRLFGWAEPTTEEIRHSLWLQEGTALAGLGLRGSAFGNFQAVLDEAAGGSHTQDAAYRLIDQLEEAIFEDRWSGYARYSQRYDDNPAVLPDVNVFGVGAPIPEPNAASLIDARINRQLIGDADWDLVAGHTYYHTLNYEQHADVDVLDALWDLTFSHRWIGHKCNLYQASISASYDYLAFGYASLLNRGTVTAGLAVVDTDMSSTFVYARYSAFDFINQGVANGSPRDLDSDNVAVGAIRSREFRPAGVTVQLGYQYDDHSADGADFDYDGHRLLAGVTWEPHCSPWTFSLFHYLYFRSYDTIDSLFGRRRTDEQYLVAATISYELRDDLDLFFEYNLDRNDSTLVISDYHRNIWGIGLLREF